MKDTRVIYLQVYRTAITNALYYDIARQDVMQDNVVAAKTMFSNMLVRDLDSGKAGFSLLLKVIYVSRSVC